MLEADREVPLAGRRRSPPGSSGSPTTSRWTIFRAQQALGSREEEVPEARGPTRRRRPEAGALESIGRKSMLELIEGPLARTAAGPDAEVRLQFREQAEAATILGKDRRGGSSRSSTRALVSLQEAAREPRVRSPSSYPPPSWHSKWASSAPRAAGRDVRSFTALTKTGGGEYGEDPTSAWRRSPTSASRRSARSSKARQDHAGNRSAVQDGPRRRPRRSSGTCARVDGAPACRACAASGPDASPDGRPRDVQARAARRGSRTMSSGGWERVEKQAKSGDAKPADRG